MSCECIQDLCQYFKPPDPPPHCNSDFIEEFRKSHKGWLKYKEECPYTTVSSNNEEECSYSTTSPSNEGSQGKTFIYDESIFKEDSGLHPNVIIGIIISVIVFIIIIIVAVYLVTQPKKRQKLKIKSRNLFQYKSRRNSGVQYTYQNYKEVNYLHSKAVRGEFYKKISTSSEVNNAAFDPDSNCNQNQPGSNQLKHSTVNKDEKGPASHHPYSNHPSCQIIVDVNSDKIETQFSLERTKDCITEQEKTKDTLATKKPHKKKNRLKRQIGYSTSDLVQEKESEGKGKPKTL